MQTGRDTTVNDSSPLPLRPYQRDALNAIRTRHAAGIRRHLVVLPTGTGKTVVFAHLAAAITGRVLVLAHRDELITQAAGKLAQVGGHLDIGIVKAAQDDTDAKVIVASVQTLARPDRLARLGRFALVIVDEAHHAVAKSYTAILHGIGAYEPDGPFTVGFTATAGRGDGLRLSDAWQEIVYQRGILQMIAEDYLCDVRGIEIGSDVDLSRVTVRGGDYTDASLGQELVRANALTAAAEGYAKYAAHRPGVAFTPTIATAHTLAQFLTGRGIPAEAVDGTTPLDDRRAILHRLRTGATQVVCNCAVLTEGWDEPAVSCALMCRPTKSAPLFVQMSGRILRPFPGKDDALILDVAGSADRLGLATIASLAGKPPGFVRPGQSLLEAAEEEEEAAAAAAATAARTAKVARFTHEVHLLRQSKLQWLPADAGWALSAGPEQTMLLVPRPDDTWEVWRKPKNAPPVRESERTLTLNWARGIGEEIARAQGIRLALARSKWRKQPPSDPQRAALARLGLTDAAADPELTKGQAADLITAHFAAREIRKLTTRLATAS